MKNDYFQIPRHYQVCSHHLHSVLNRIDRINLDMGSPSIHTNTLNSPMFSGSLLTAEEQQCDPSSTLATNATTCGNPLPCRCCAVSECSDPIVMVCCGNVFCKRYVEFPQSIFAPSNRIHSCILEELANSGKCPDCQTKVLIELHTRKVV